MQFIKYKNYKKPIISERRKIESNKCNFRYPYLNIEEQNKMKGGIMKKINTYQVLETKIRIYESWFLKELSDYFEKHKKDYRTKNDFYVSLIRVGLETEKIRDENFADYNGKLQSISDKLTEFSQKLDNTNGANNSLIRD